MYLYHKQQQGRSMIEMLGVLAVIGVLTVAAIAMYSAAMSKYKTGKAKEQINVINQGVVERYYTKDEYGTGSEPDLTEILIKTAVIPADMKGNPPKNPWGGETTVYGNSIGGSLNDSFKIIYTEVPEEACLDLAIIDWGSNLDEIRVGNNTTAPDDAPMTDEQAITACTDENTIEFIFK